MRIRYSVVIPVLFMGFCGVFILVLYITEQAKREQEQEALAADKMQKLIREEDTSIRGTLRNMDEHLDRNDLEGAVSLYQEIRDNISNMYDFADGIPREEWREQTKRYIAALEAELERMNEFLVKGDITKAQSVITSIITSR